ILHPQPPPRDKSPGPVVLDLSDRVKDPQQQEDAERRARDQRLPRTPAWHGTLLPKTDADIWLATAFAHYQQIFSLEKSLRDRAKDGRLRPEDRERLALSLFAHRVGFTAAAQAGKDVPLARTQADPGANDWYRVAAGKGVLVLHALRQ